jgi:glucokinase
MIAAPGTSAAKAYGLVADIGGTNVRFAAVDPRLEQPEIVSLRVLSTRGHPDIVGAAKTYLRDAGLDAPPMALVFAVAGPVEHNEIHLTNAGWRISADELRQGLGARYARLVNDFEAVAQAVPHLQDRDLAPIGP